MLKIKSENFIVIVSIISGIAITVASIIIGYSYFNRSKLQNQSIIPSVSVSTESSLLKQPKENNIILTGNNKTNKNDISDISAYEYSMLEDAIDDLLKEME